MNDKLQSQIDKWLFGRREASYGGWAVVTDKDVHELRGIVLGLIEAKCEADADGDRPIDVLLINRRKFRPVFHSPVAYEGSYDDVQRPMMSNVSDAIDQLNIEMQILRRKHERDPR